jgi:FkbM family methyltransferase
MDRSQPNSVDRLIGFLNRRKLRGHLGLFRYLRGDNPAATIKAATKHHLQLHLNPLHYIDQQILTAGYFEEEVLDAILAGIGDQSVLWDVGANIGVHALTVKLLRPATRVYCFEPSSLACTRLEANSALNGLAVSVWPIALSDRDGFASLSMNQNADPGFGSLVANDENDRSMALHCRCERADSLHSAGLIPLPDVVKIDVEGAELSVLEGMRGILERGHPKSIVLESVALAEDREKSEVAKLLSAFDYDVTPMRSADGRECHGNFVVNKRAVSLL